MSERLPTYMKRKLFSELRDRFDGNHRCPSLAWIVKFLRLRNVDQAEKILTEMQVDGVITVIRMGPYPWVSLLRNSYAGVKVTGMDLDPERFGAFTDGNDVLVVKAAPEPRVLPKAGGEVDDFEDDEELPPLRVARPARPVPPELPKVETVEEARVSDVPRASLVDHGPEATSQLIAAETESEPVAAPLQAVEARDVPQGDDDGRRSNDGAEHQRRADSEQCDAPRLPGADGCGEAPDAADQGHGAGILEHVRPDGVEPRIVDRQDEDRRSGDVGGETRHPVAVSVPEVAAAPSAPRTRQVTFTVTAEQYAALQKRAAGENVAVGRAAYNTFLEGLAGPADAAPQPKPRIPAAFMTALRHDGRPFNQFHDDLLALGLEQYLAFRAAE